MYETNIRNTLLANSCALKFLLSQDQMSAITSRSSAERCEARTSIIMSSTIIIIHARQYHNIVARTSIMWRAPQ